MKSGFTGSHLGRQSRRVITVEIKLRKNASDSSDCDQMAGVSKRFITRDDVASSRESDCNPTAMT